MSVDQKTDNVISAKQFLDMFMAAAKNLEKNKEWINDLNVFPVPDGDTGTNMTLTMLSAVEELKSVENPSMDQLARAISSGSLRGARGNSGVILSQLLRGFTREIRDYSVIDPPTLANAFRRAEETAYKAVMKPKEGTVLTVARGIADKAAEIVEENPDIPIKQMLEVLIKEGDRILSMTPDLLPVLKEAGVVDSGGTGLMQVIRGAYDGYCGKEIEGFENAPADVPTDIDMQQIDRENIETADIKFGYCTEFIIVLEREFGPEDEAELKGYLESIGDSIICVSDDELVKIHVHTNDPGLAIQKGLTYGSLTRMKIDNMREEHRETLFHNTTDRGPDILPAEEEPAPLKPYGFISVSVGEGLNEIFKSLGIDELVEGGQTMNPSTQDMLDAVERVEAETIFILPNNKNIVMAAEQAAKMMREKNVIVIPSATVPQGIAAVIAFNPELSPKENADLMTSQMREVRSAEVTYAVRNTSVDGVEIHEGDYMGLGDDGLLSGGPDLKSVVLSSIAGMIDEDSVLISLYTGTGADPALTEEIEETLLSTYPDCDVEVHEGGQPVYYYLMSVE